MTTYQYTSPENTVVAVIDDDGISRSSCIASILPEGTVIEPYVAPPTPIPTTITMRQARLVLLGAGLLNSVSTAINALPSPQKEAAQIEWEYSNEVQRNNGFVSQLAPALGLTEAQLDALFLAGASL